MVVFSKDRHQSAFTDVNYFFVKIPATKKPIKAPYNVLLIGLEVIMHVPLEQPTNFQYKKPAIAPRVMPINSRLYL
jgi:hypothetical protein